MDRKYKFILGGPWGNILSREYSMTDILTEGLDYEKILEDLEPDCYNNCLNESQSYCDCESEYAEHEHLGVIESVNRTDKNGKDLWESDIVKCENGNIFIIEFDEMFAKFFLQSITINVQEPSWNNLIYMEKIGNRHLNYELLIRIIK